MAEEDFLESASLIALRKTDLYRYIMEEIPQEKDISPEEDAKIRAKISALDNAKFITRQEKKSKTLSPDVTLEELEIDKESLLEELGINLD